MRLLATLFAFLLSISAACATDCSGTITSGGTAQLAFPSTSLIQTVMVQNNSANMMCVSINGVAAALGGTNCSNGFALQPGSGTTQGGSYVTPPGIKAGYLSVITSTTGDRYACERQ